MAKLTDAHKRIIVQALACWDTPTEVSALLREQFGIDVHRTQVAQYDPTKVAGKAMGKAWVQLFNDTRARFRAEVAEIPIADQAFRLRALGKIYARHMERGNAVGATQVLEQAAKEVGGMFTNRRELSGPDGGPIPVMPTTVELVAPSVDQSED